MLWKIIYHIAFFAEIIGIILIVISVHNLKKYKHIDRCVDLLNIGKIAFGIALGVRILLAIIIIKLSIPQKLYCIVMIGLIAWVLYAHQKKKKK